MYCSQKTLTLLITFFLSSISTVVNNTIETGIGHDLGVDDLVGTVYDTAGLDQRTWPQKLFGTSCIFTSVAFLIDGVMSGIQMRS